MHGTDQASQVGSGTADTSLVAIAAPTELRASTKECLETGQALRG